jgi:IS30 family transposase
MQGHHGHLSTEQKQMAFRLHAHGWRLIDIAREIGCTAPMVGKMVREHKHIDGHPFGWEPRAGCLSIFEREQIMLGIGEGESLSAIARDLGRSASTITREVNANGGRGAYSAWGAHERARGEARRPKPCKLRRGKLLREVSRRLEQLWSPEEIAHRLPLDYPDDEEMRVSHETIYQSLFVQGRGELRRELARCLRSGRTARFVLLLHLHGDRSADAVDAAMRKAVATLPDELCQSITWDQGAEMANHVDFTVATDIPIYFCDPHAPWQRGSNENTNGLLRQFLPKGIDLSKVSATELRQIQRSLNGRPRKTLGYMTPSEKFTEFVASTA